MLLCPGPAKAAIGLQRESLARKSEQNIEATQLPALRGALQQEWITFGPGLIEPAQLTRSRVPWQQLSQML